ncbi:threonylcarbamoyl-AMP synthase [Leptospira levettii]|uniref:L-threonylcarbamoyladenylate synthase n=1 Tax=Leptospira levettii TaxID=2023178 RepID=A0A2N0AWW6_9LEPT|nr:L-threonylcarbamoyladenylate synthase [Leptospira levettii]PKA27857.1 threonylcarbamoyl-AMP synthase [Leptospira sp. mixed culture ATI2-C-A1]MCG6147289.1 threonylcarbamoyl-AMP synthase [Leptospira levettii]MCW7465427.1 L-threonylcarbamoyladenylate synthase [Leptospira levettii]MCW7496265.1 L-threonylcarbamoyladenylate synthase [Leptospira levettii]MCW7507360.1 L-threonylcarbamoyladenylate synthase [Leptospira levettii]
MIIYLHPDNPEVRKLKQISERLKDGAIYIFPTDTVYAIIADAHSKTAVEKIYSIKKLPKDKPLSLLCKDISMASHFIEYLPNSAYRFMKRVTPGPFTFVLKANKNLPKPSIAHHKDKQIGIRIPDHIYLQELLKIHESPLTSTSAFSNDEFIIDIDDLDTIYGNLVEGIVDGGIVKTELSTMIQINDDSIELIRAGKGYEQIENEIQNLE